MIYPIKNKKIIAFLILLLCLLQMNQLFSFAYACSLPTPREPYKFVEIQGFDGDCYAKIIYPKQNWWQDVRTEVYASRVDLEPIITFPSERWNIRLYCNRTLENQNGMVIVTVKAYVSDEHSKALSFYFNDTFQKMYIVRDFAVKGVDIVDESHGVGSCFSQYQVWDINQLSNILQEAYGDKPLEDSLVRIYEEQYISIVDDREILSLTAWDQSTLLFDLLTGEFIERKTHLHIK